MSERSGKDWIHVGLQNRITISLYDLPDGPGAAIGLPPEALPPEIQSANQAE
jgi:hypothetical protein